jgi:hypothetical protein
LVGVNSDPELETAQAAVAKHRLNWRSWWAGGADGPIPRQWQVASWPTIYVIDARGIIRHQLTNAQNLDRIVENLLRETETN